MNTAYISIGGNLGDRVRNLRRALIYMHREEEIAITKVSSFYETAPWGKIDQPSFLNAAVKIFTSLSPKDLLQKLNVLEKKLGRVRYEHWGERIIDIDIIDYEGVTSKGELNLPHPFFDKRKFVLEPLFEIAPKLVINGIDIETYLKNCPDESSVIKTIGSPKDFQMTVIAAADKGLGIGYNNKLIYKIKSDMARFRELTLNNIIIVGKNTFLEMGALDKRTIIVLSKKEEFTGEGVYTVNSITNLFSMLDKYPDKRIFVAGGQEIFKLLIPYATRADITRISGTKPADEFLPPLHDFILQKILITEENGLKFAFCTFFKE